MDLPTTATIGTVASLTALWLLDSIAKRLTRIEKLLDAEHLRRREGQ